MKENERIIRHLEQAVVGINLAMAHMYKATEIMGDEINNPEVHVCNLDLTIADRIIWSLECDVEMLKALTVEYEARK